MRTFRRVCDEIDNAGMPAKIRRIARARQDQVNHEYQRATRVVERLLQAHGGRQEERRPPAGGGHREERKYQDDFGAGRAAEQRMEYEDSIPIERRPTLPVTEILAAERQERSWESAPGAGWCRPAMADRGRGIGDLGMAVLNIGAPARLQRGGRALLPAGASTPLGGSSGELPRTYSGSSARVDYWRRLEMNAGQRRGCAVPTGDEIPRERGRWLLRPPASRCRGEQSFSACAAAGCVRVPDSI
jgi:hypothetical protein